MTKVTKSHKLEGDRPAKGGNPPTNQELTPEMVTAFANVLREAIGLGLDANDPQSKFETVAEELMSSPLLARIRSRS